MIIPADTRTVAVRDPRRPRVFRPHGPLHKEPGMQRNPADWRSHDTLAARLLVGFKVGDEDRWTLDDLITLVRRERRKAGRAEDSSFVAQKGVFTHHSGHVVQENGGQVIIINLAEIDMAAFEAEMIALAETVAASMEQESIVLEIQKNGISQVTMGVAP